MKMFAKRDTRNALVVVIAMIVGLLVLSVPNEANAQTSHILCVQHCDYTPWQNIEVMVFVQTGPDPDDPDDWDVEWGVTGANGKFYCNLLESAEATRWYYQIGQGYVGGDPAGDWVNYPSKYKLCVAAFPW